MERNVKNLLTLGAKIHISCVSPENRHKHDYDSLDENIARCFIEDSLSDGLIWKDWCYPSPDITKCYRIHHDMTFERWKAPGLAGMGISLPQCQVMNSKRAKNIPSPLKEEGIYVIRTIICLPFSVSIKSSPKGHKKSTAEAMLLKPYY